MRWETSPNKIAPLENLSISKTLKKETNEDRDGGNPSNVKGYEPQPLTCEYTADKIVGGDPLREYEAWKRQVGKKGPFYLGGRRLGPFRLQLQEVGLSSVELDAFGGMRRATISLSFIQDGGGGSSSGSSSNTSGISSGSAVTSALGVGPSQSAIKQKAGR